jgi:hypothetical protein
MNRDVQFWLTLGSLVTLLLLFSFIIYCGYIEEFTFKKEYCLFSLPSIIYLGFQFIVNYAKLVKDKK